MKGIKNIIDDGFYAEIVETAVFTGHLEIPLIKTPGEFIIPYKMIPFAFLGIEKHGIYSIGTYGCCKTTEYKHHLREGLRSFIKEIEPRIILVYGAMPDSIFEEFKKDVQFVHFDDWTKTQHLSGEKKNG